MKVGFDEYSKAYEHVEMRREDGIIELRLHTDGNEFIWGAEPHTELGYCFADVGSDVENQIVILTGTGNVFINQVVAPEWSSPLSSEVWSKIYAHGRRMLMNLLDIEVPVIAAVNGPASVHSELAVMNDIVLASDDSYFSDEPHFRQGVVPGDGVHVIWPAILGPNRGRHFLLSAKRIHAQEALDLGVVAEVLPREEVLDRAWHLARALRKRPNKSLRYTRLLMTQHLKSLFQNNLNLGLALEGLSGHDYWPAAPLDYHELGADLESEK